MGAFFTLTMDEFLHLSEEEIRVRISALRLYSSPLSPYFQAMGFQSRHVSKLLRGNRMITYSSALAQNLTKPMEPKPTEATIKQEMLQ